MRTWVVALVVALVVGLGALGARAADEPKALAVQVTGNLVLADEVYHTLVRWAVLARREAAGVASDAALDADDAEAAALSVRRLLVESGYELARVQADLASGGLVLEVNEGRVARVLFRGHSTVETLELQLKLDVPHDVFNRKVVQRQLDALKLDPGFEHTTFELVTLPEFTHLGPQLAYVGRSDLTPPPPLPYELHVVVGRERWQTGLSFELGYESIRGALLDGAYAGEGALFTDDRYRLALGLGAGPFARLDTGASEVRLSRARLGGTYIGPPLLTGLRPFGHADVELSVRQRRDLMLQSYALLVTSALGELSYRHSGYFTLTLGMGGEYRRLFDIDQVIVEPPLPEQRGFDEVRGFGRLRLDVTFDPENVRLDRHHTLSLAADSYVGADLFRAEGAYAKVFGFGWHDLWLRLAGGGVFGEVRFVDELALANYLRSLFMHEYWVPWVGIMSWELRWSVRQELFKVGVFFDSGIFGDLGRGRHRAGSKGAVASGLGVHGLVLDVLQLDVYYALGATTDGKFSQGITLGASKAF